MGQPASRHFPDIDLANVDNFNDGVPHEWFSRLRREEPLYWQEEPDGPGFWNVTKYADLIQVSKQPNLYSSWRGGTNVFELAQAELEGSRLLMLNMDPPQHAKYRRLVSKGFTPKRIEMLIAHIGELAKTIVDDVAEQGECDFVDAVAARLPMETICEMIGVPESDRRHVYDLSNKLIGFDDPDFQHNFEDAPMALADMYGYAENLAHGASRTAARRSRHRAAERRGGWRATHADRVQFVLHAARPRGKRDDSDRYGPRHAALDRESRRAQPRASPTRGCWRQPSRRYSASTRR